MTVEQIADTFRAAHPKAVDFLQSEYEQDKAVFDRLAAEFGYRLAGFREKRAVFTTKEPPAPDVPQPTRG